MSDKQLDNCCYNKVKLLCEVSKLIWFIEKHAEQDAQKAQNQNCLKEVKELKKDLEKHVAVLNQLVCNNAKK